MIDIAYERNAHCSVFAILLCAGLLCHVPRGEAAPARFWISLNGSNPIAPEAPTLNLENGGRRTIHVWGRPATDDVNFKNLQNLSLNLVPAASSAAIYNIVDSFQVFNPGNRFEIVRDASNPVGSPIASMGSPESVRGLTAAVAQTNLFTGIGNDAGDSSCSGGCEPSWRIASFEIGGVASSGSASLHLQIGSLGMNHAGEFSEMTEVVFGNDPSSVSYNGKNNREQTLPNDTPDLILNAIPFLAGDYNGDSSVNAADYVIWRDNLGTSSNLPGDTTSGSVSLQDYNVWKSNFGAVRASAASIAVPAPEPRTSYYISIAALVSLCSWRSAKLRVMAEVPHA